MSARLSPQERLLRTIPEANFQATVETIATRLGWQVFHPADNRPVTSSRGHRYVQNIRAGFPDLVMAKGNRLICAELKRQTGVISDDQRSWLDTLALTGRCEVYLWRPANTAELTRILQGHVSVADETRWHPTEREAAS